MNKRKHNYCWVKVDNDSLNALKKDDIDAHAANALIGVGDEKLN